HYPHPVLVVGTMPSQPDDRAPTERSQRIRRGRPRHSTGTNPERDEPPRRRVRRECRRPTRGAPPGLRTHPVDLNEFGLAEGGWRGAAVRVAHLGGVAG